MDAAALVDLFDGDSEMESFAAEWQRYFDDFTCAVRNNC